MMKYVAEHEGRYFVGSVVDGIVSWEPATLWDPTVPGPTLLELSATAKAARKPLPLEELVDAQHDRVHRDRGQAC